MNNINNKLNIKIHSDSYHSDNIMSGRVSKDFFLELCKNIFNQSFEYWEKYGKNADLLPIIHSEQKSKSTFAAALNKITPIHTSEETFYKKDLKKTNSKEQQSRYIDFWCETTGNKVNYFIELKQGSYCISKGAEDKRHCTNKNKINKLLDQIDDIKKIEPEWENKEVYLGIMIFLGKYNKNKEPILDSDKKLYSYLSDSLDKRKGIEIISSTWYLPNEIKETMKRNDDYKIIYDWISIVGFVLTKKRTSKSKEK